VKLVCRLRVGMGVYQAGQQRFVLTINSPQFI
jgi:hypothetical protein